MKMVSCNGDGKEFQGLVPAYSCAFWPGPVAKNRMNNHGPEKCGMRQPTENARVTKTATQAFFVIHMLYDKVHVEYLHCLPALVT